MIRLMLVLTIFLSGSAFAAAAGSSPASAVQGFLNSFNVGDIAAVEATQADDVVIVDEFAPFRWHGDGAFTRWLDALGKHDAASGVTDGHMAMGDTIREEVSGDHAYVVMATVYSFKENGVSMRAPAQMTFALHNGAAGWRISAWTYSAPRGSAAM